MPSIAGIGIRLTVAFIIVTFLTAVSLKISIRIITKHKQGFLTALKICIISFFITSIISVSTSFLFTKPGDLNIALSISSFLLIFLVQSFIYMKLIAISDLPPLSFKRACLINLLQLAIFFGILLVIALIVGSFLALVPLMGALCRHA